MQGDRKKPAFSCPQIYFKIIIAFNYDNSRVSHRDLKLFARPLPAII